MFRAFFRKHAAQELYTSRLFNNDTFYQSFTTDLYCAQRSVYIDSPFITSKRMDKLMPILQKLRQHGIRITVNTRDPKEHDTEYKSQAARAICEMKKLGIKVLYTVRLHRKIAIIDEEILYEGSLNILSQIDSCEVMRRTVSQQITNEMVRFIKADRWL